MKRAFGSRANHQVVSSRIAGYSAAGAKDHPSRSRRQRNMLMLEKLGAVVGVSNLHIYAAMRGETLEEFRKTRNAPARCTRWPARRQRVRGLHGTQPAATFKHAGRVKS
jgi:hypothetical protein